MKTAILFKNRNQARTGAERRVDDRRDNPSAFGGLFNALRPLIG
jgi:hypothetical protein